MVVNNLFIYVFYLDIEYCIVEKEVKRHFIDHCHTLFSYLSFIETIFMMFVNRTIKAKNVRVDLQLL
jgi:hypothetical protein